MTRPLGLALAVLFGLSLVVSSASAEEPCPTGKPPAKVKDDGQSEVPCPTGKQPKKDGEDIPRFGTGSPFDANYAPPQEKQAKRIWAKSILWDKAPELVVEKWLNEKPETKGKYLLIEFWATWCPPCRRSLPILNRFHEKFKDELVVIAVSDETEEAVRRLEAEKGPIHQFYSAIDTQKRMKDYCGVFGIPHAIIVEPGGFVVWEGFPLLKNYELTEALIERILAIGRKQKQQEKKK